MSENDDSMTDRIDSLLSRLERETETEEARVPVSAPAPEAPQAHYPPPALPQHAPPQEPHQGTEGHYTR